MPIHPATEISFTRNPDGARVLTCELWLPRPREEVFAFFADALNLERLTPTALRFRILTPSPIAMHAGALIDYQLRLHGIPITWRTRITQWEPPGYFADEQLRGPYRRWVHEHRFVERDGGTHCSDRVEYLAPLGFFSYPLIERDLRGIFTYRAQVLQDFFAK